MSRFHPFPQPIGTTACDYFAASVDGSDVCVHPMKDASFTVYRSDEAHRVQVVVADTIQPESVFVRPLRLEIQPAVNGQTIEFNLPANQNLALEVNGRFLYFFAVNPTEPTTEKVRRYAAGFVYHEGFIELDSDETLWIEPGAIVHALVRSHGKNNVHIGGGGILWANTPGSTGWNRAVVFDGCTNLTVKDISIVDPLSWMLSLNACEHVYIENLHEIGEVIGSDGIDIVGSRHVHVNGGFLRNNDDNIAVKAKGSKKHEPSIQFDPERDTYDILVENLICANSRAGNGLEIGHELRCSEVRDITFRNIDLLHCHGHGAPISVNCGDRATVHSVLFEDIRIEHFYDKLVNIRVMKSRFNQDQERGQIRDITLKNIRVTESIYNPGYSIAVIGGYDADHMVRGIHFENFTLGGRQIQSNDDWDLYTRHCEGITYA